MPGENERSEVANRSLFTPDNPHAPRLGQRHTAMASLISHEVCEYKRSVSKPKQAVATNRTGWNQGER